MNNHKLSVLLDKNTANDTFFKTWLDKIFSVSFWNKTQEYTILHEVTTSHLKHFGFIINPNFPLHPK